MEHTTTISRGISHYFAECTCGWGQIFRYMTSAEKARSEHLDLPEEFAEEREWQVADDKFGGTTLGY